MFLIGPKNTSQDYNVMVMSKYNVFVINLQSVIVLCWFYEVFYPVTWIKVSFDNGKKDEEASFD